MTLCGTLWLVSNSLIPGATLADVLVGVTLFLGLDLTDLTHTPALSWEAMCHRSLSLFMLSQCDSHPLVAMTLREGWVGISRMFLLGFC